MKMNIDISIRPHGTCFNYSAYHNAFRLNEKTGVEAEVTLMVKSAYVGNHDISVTVKVDDKVKTYWGELFVEKADTWEKHNTMLIRVATDKEFNLTQIHYVA